MTNWEEELKKCKEDPAYFFLNYCRINGQKPSEYSVEAFKEYLEDNKRVRSNFFKRTRLKTNNNLFLFNNFVTQHPLTPEECFPQINLIENDRQNK